MSLDENDSAGRSRLSAQKQALLAKLIGGRRQAGAATGGIPRRDPGVRPPLSFAQRRLWFLDRMVPGSPAYNVVMTFAIHGPLRPDILGRAVDEIVRRHEALRTTLPDEDGDPWQRVAEEMHIPIVTHDLRDAPHRVDGLIAELARAPFDLVEGPLLRVVLFRPADEQWVVFLNAHHVVVDGWSLGLFWEELLTLYDAFAAGRPSPFAELPIQYPDFAIWQREHLTGDRLETQLSYWRERLSGGTEHLELPFDRPRPVVQTFDGGDAELVFPGPLRTALQELARSQGVGLFTVLLAALKALLHRYTGQSDIAVGSPVTNRTHVDVEPLIGFFVNTLVHRTAVSGELTFAELVARVQEGASAAQRHQEVPFEAVVEALRPERYLSQNPLFQVCFSFLPARPLRSPAGLTVERISGVRNATAKFDLWISVVDRNDDLLVEVEYDSSVFDHATIDRLLAAYRTLLDEVASATDTTIARLPVMTAEERTRIETEWGPRSHTTPAPAELAHELFAAHARATPDAVAVRCEGVSLTYRELDERAAALAAALRDRGVGRGTLVALVTERSPELVLGVLGILKAGGAYVPIDPTYPGERIQYLLTDSKAGIVVTQRHLVDRLPLGDAAVVTVDGHPPAADPGRLPGANPQDPAYVIYTSGSTGMPKGAVVSHANITRLFSATDHWFHFGPRDTWTLFHSFSFDFSVWELWGALAHGGRLVIVPYGVSRSPEEFLELLRAERVTVLNQTPLAFRHLTAAEETAPPGELSLRLVIFGGEALDVPGLRPWFDRHGDQRPRLINMYGITETTVHVTFREITRADLDWASPGSPIGRQIPDLSVRVVDSYGEPSPIGVRGELYVGGAGVAVGYLDRPKLTAERFVDGPAGREYRSGDLVRWLSNGELEYLGRADQQVKIRGHRIELGEVGTALTDHPGVREAIVLPEDDGNRLVAYVIPEPGQVEEATDDRGVEWRDVFDRVYGDGLAIEPDFDIRGWDSSYTGEPLSPLDMWEWVGTTVDRVLELGPRRVLEIGCGTGLLLSRIAPHCAEYHGTDMSETAVRQLRDTVVAARADLSAVQLHVLPAHDLSAFGPGQFDTVVINSVVQYFPDPGYLREVIAGALRVVADGGVVFVGDVRALQLFDTFHTDVELRREAAGHSAAQARSRIRHAAAQDRELVLDPAFFDLLRRDQPRISRVETQLRRGERDNEMTRYRYDALLHAGAPAEQRVPDTVVEWVDGRTTLAEVETLVRDRDPEAVVVRGVPNARLADVAAALAALDRADADDPAPALASRPGPQRVDAVHPELWWRLARRLGRSAALSWAPGAADGRYSVVLATPGTRGRWVAHPPAAGVRPEDTSTDPVFARAAAALVPRLRAHLKDRLPDYMVPSAFVPLNRFPINANGKLDRAALPPALPDPVGDAEDSTEPTTPVERVLAEIWEEVLGTGRVGTGSNFFRLGGDSIHTITVVSAARKRGLQLTPQMLFQHDTLGELAAAVSAASVPAETGPAAETSDDVVAGLRVDPGVEAVYPLAPFQSWALRTLLAHPAAGAFQVHRLTAMPRGLVDPEVFRTAATVLARAYEVLRTSFVWQGVDEPVQVVHREPQVEFEYVDWRGLAPSEQDAALERHLAADRVRGVDPAVPAGLRYLVADVDDGHCLMVVSLSYLCLDGWSFNIIANQFDAVIADLLAGRTPAPETGLRFRDFIAEVERRDRRAEADYWRRALAGLREPTQLARRVPGNRIGAAEGFGRQWISLPDDLAAGLRELVQQRKVTLNTLFQAGWAITVAALTGEGDHVDVVHGMLMTGRSSGLDGAETMVGPTLNILPLRTRVDGAEPVPQFLRRVMVEIAEVGAHEHSVLDEALSHSELPPGQLPCESYLVFQNVGVDTSERFPPGYYVSRMGFPLRLDVFPTSVMTMHISYYRDLFSDDTVALLIGGYAAVMRALLAAGDRPLREVLAAARRAGAPTGQLSGFREGGFVVKDIVALAGGEG
ncbi:amino acid adenylation domain-containing protein [Micromonospora sp. NPDC002296]|uniref:non-ribosomal peptide synthetase n=1 Tax=Micromonospora sp. NPDC002296 TaxID=3154271 RepID=UPI0033229F78